MADGAEKCIGKLTLDTTGVKNAVKEVNDMLADLGVGKKVNISTKVTAAVKESLKDIETLLAQSEKKIAETAEKAAKSIEQIGKAKVDNEANKKSIQSTIALYEKLHNARNKVYELDQKGQKDSTAYARAAADVEKYEYALSRLSDKTRQAAQSTKEYDAIINKSVSVQNAAKATAEAKEVENATKAYLKLLDAKSKVKQLEAEGKQDTEEYLKATQSAGKAYDAFIQYSKGAREAAKASKEAAQARKDLNVVEEKVVEDTSKVDYLAKVKQQYFELTDAIKNYNTAKQSGDEAGMAEATARINAATQEVAVIHQAVEASNMEASAKQQVLNYIQQCTTAEKQHDAEINKSVSSTSELESQVNGLLTRYLSLMAVIRGISSLIQNMVEYVSDYSNKMSEIQMITLKSNEEVAQLADKYRNIAKEMSASSLDIADAAIYFTRQGLRTEEIEDRLRNVTKYAKAANVEFKDASEIITAVVNSMGLLDNALGDGRTAAERVADVFLKVGDNAATSGQEIGEAMQKAAASAGAFGVSFEWLSSAIATVSETTRQEARTIGTAFNTIIARLHQIKQSGYNSDDETKLNDVAKALAKIDVVLMDQTGEWRDMEDIWNEVAEKWGDLDGKTKSYIATTMAGVKQQNVFLAAMNDMSKTIEEGGRFWELYGLAIDSAGTATEKYDVYLQSVEASQERLTIAQEKFYSIMSDDVIKGWYDALAGFVGMLADGADAWGSWTIIVPAVIGVITAVIVAIKGLNASLTTTVTLASLLEKHPIMMAISAATLVVAGLVTVINAVASGVETAEERLSRLDKTISDSKSKAEQYNKTLSDFSDMMGDVGKDSKMTSDEVEKYKDLLHEIALISPQAAAAIENIKNNTGDQKEEFEKANAELERYIKNRQIFAAMTLSDKADVKREKTGSDRLAELLVEYGGSFSAIENGIDRYSVVNALQDDIKKFITDLVQRGFDWDYIDQLVRDEYLNGQDAYTHLTKSAEALIDEYMNVIGMTMNNVDKSAVRSMLGSMIFGDDGILDLSEYQNMNKVLKEFIEKAIQSLFDPSAMMDTKERLTAIGESLFGDLFESMFGDQIEDFLKKSNASTLLNNISSAISDLMAEGFSDVDIKDLLQNLNLEDWVNAVDEMKKRLANKSRDYFKDTIGEILEKFGTTLEDLDIPTLKVINSLADLGIGIEDVIAAADNSDSLGEFISQIKILGKITGDSEEKVRTLKDIFNDIGDTMGYMKDLDAFRSGSKDAYEMLKSAYDYAATRTDVKLSDLVKWDENEKSLKFIDIAEVKIDSMINELAEQIGIGEGSLETFRSVIKSTFKDAEEEADVLADAFKNLGAAFDYIEDLEGYRAGKTTFFDMLKSAYAYAKETEGINLSDLIKWDDTKNSLDFIDITETKLDGMIDNLAKELKIGEDNMASFRDAVKKSFEEASEEVDTLKNAFSSVADAFDYMKDISSYRQGEKGLFETLKSAYEYAEKMENISISDLIKWDDTTGTLDFVDLTEQQIDDFIDNLAAQLGDGIKDLDKFRSAIKESFKEVKEETDSLSGAIKGIGDAFSYMSDVASYKAGNKTLFDTIKSAYEYASNHDKIDISDLITWNKDNKSVQFVDIAESQINEMIDVLATKLGVANEDLETFRKAVKDSFAEVKDEAKELKTAITDVGDAFDYMKDISDYGKGKKNLFDMIKSAYEYASNHDNIDISDLITWDGENKIVQFKDITESELNDIIDTLANKLGVVEGDLEKFRKAVKEAFEESTEEATGLKAAINNVGDAFSYMKDISDYSQGDKNLFNMIKSAYEYASNHEGVNIADLITWDKDDKSLQFVKLTEQSVNEMIDTLIEQLDIGVDDVDAFRDAVKEAFQETKNSADELKTAITDIGDAFGYMKDVSEYGKGKKTMFDMIKSAYEYASSKDTIELSDLIQWDEESGAIKFIDITEEKINELINTLATKLGIEGEEKLKKFEQAVKDSFAEAETETRTLQNAFDELGDAVGYLENVSKFGDNKKSVFEMLEQAYKFAKDNETIKISDLISWDGKDIGFEVDIAQTYIESRASEIAGAIAKAMNEAGKIAESDIAETQQKIKDAIVAATDDIGEETGNEVDTIKQAFTKVGDAFSYMNDVISFKEGDKNLFNTLKSAYEYANAHKIDLSQLITWDEEAGAVKFFDLTEESINDMINNLAKELGIGEEHFEEFGEAVRKCFEEVKKKSEESITSIKESIEDLDDVIGALATGDTIEFKDLVNLMTAHPEIMATINDLEKLEAVLNKLRGEGSESLLKGIGDMLLGNEDVMRNSPFADKMTENIRTLEEYRNTLAEGTPEFEAVTRYLEQSAMNLLATTDQLNKVDTSKIKEWMGMFFGENGNVDLGNRPTIDAKLLEAAGWEGAGDGIATIFSGTYSAGGRGADIEWSQNVVMNLTPITPDGEKILSPEALDDYLWELLQKSANIDELVANDKAENGGLGLLINVRTLLDGESFDEAMDAESRQMELLHLLQQAIYGVNEAEKTWLQTQAQKIAMDQDAQWAKTNGYEDQINSLLESLEDGGAEAALEKFNGYLSLNKDLVSGLASEYPNLITQLADVEAAQNDYNKAVEEYGENSQQAKDALAKLEKETKGLGSELKKNQKYLNTKYFKDTAKAAKDLSEGTISVDDAYEKLNKELNNITKAYEDVDDVTKKLDKNADVTVSDVSNLSKVLGMSAEDILADWPAAVDMFNSLTSSTGEFQDAINALNDAAFIRITGTSDADFSAISAGLISVQNLADEAVAKLAATGQWTTETIDLPQQAAVWHPGENGGGFWSTETMTAGATVLKPTGNNPFSGGSRGGSSGGKGGGGGGGGGGGKNKDTSSKNQMTEVERVLDRMSQAKSIQDYQQNYYQSQQKYYSQTGQIQGVIAYMERESDALIEQNKSLESNIKQIESYMDKKRAELATLSTSDEKYEEVSDDLDKLQKAHQDYTKQVIDNKTAIDALNESMDEERKKIRQMEIDLRNTVLKAIEDREAKRKDMLDNEIEMENIILGLITKRYEKERDQIIETTNLKIEALEQEKDLLEEQLRIRKEQAEEEDKVAKLKELEVKYQRIIADPTRAKEAQQIKKEIDDLRKDMAWDLAEKEVEAQKDSIDQQITSLEDYQEYIENYYEDLFEHPQRLIEEMREIIMMSQEEIIQWLKDMDEEYQNSSENTQTQMVENWTQTYKDMKGILTLYWEEVEEIISKGDEYIINFLKENSSDYAKAGKLQAEAYVDEWRKQLDDLKKAHEKVAADIAAQYKVIEKAASSASSSGGGSSGGGGGGTKKTTTTTSSHTPYYTVSVNGTENRFTNKADAEAYANKMKATFGSMASKMVGAVQGPFALGGLAKGTGLAWLDGTQQDPERVLSPYQTKLFETMVHALEQMNNIYVPSMPNFAGLETSGGNPVSVGDIIVNVDNLDTDDDYEELARKVSEVLMEEIGRTAVVGGLRIRSI